MFFDWVDSLGFLKAYVSKMGSPESKMGSDGNDGIFREEAGSEAQPASRIMG